MQVAAVGIVERAEIPARGKRGANLLPRHVARAVVLQPLLQLLELPAQLAVVARLHGRQHVAVDPVAVDVVAGDELPHEGEPFDGHVPDRPRSGAADQPLQLALACRYAMDRLRAAAAGGTPADP